MGRVIAIDGPSGAGKSTLAKMLADRLGFSYLDTGALYRAVALLFLSKGVRPEDDDEGLEEILRRSEVRMDNGRLMLNNKDVSTDIRTPEVGHYSSVFSARKVVRDFLLDVQRQTASVSDIVVEGRDTTTVIFPDAWKKFYMDAPVSGRARRRYLQLRQMGMDVTEEDAEKDVIERDNRDSKRDIAPLMKAGDAVIIDTTDKSIDEVLNCLLGACR
ncbi:MAG: (d)CMP kinase [Nitrospirota bacterium]